MIERTQASDHVETAFIAQSQIHHGQMRLPFTSQRDGLAAIRCEENLPSPRLKRAP